MKEIETVVRSYTFISKNAKSYVLVSIVKAGCLRISTRLDPMNNKALNTRLKSIYINLCDIMIKNYITSCLNVLKSYYMLVKFDASDKEDPIKYWYRHCMSGAR